MYVGYQKYMNKVEMGNSRNKLNKPFHIARSICTNVTKEQKQISCTYM